MIIGEGEVFGCYSIRSTVRIPGLHLPLLPTAQLRFVSFDRIGIEIEYATVAPAVAAIAVLRPYRWNRRGIVV
jgi:hypothetical protein